MAAFIPKRSRLLLIAAHPDDETIGAAGLLRGLQLDGGVEIVVAHVTDGAPANLRYARAAGFDSPAAYARARRRELLKALRRLPCGPPTCLTLGFRDQEVIHNMRGAVDAMSDAIVRSRANVVMTHPYEGGHPDHDATAFAAHAAVRRIAAAGHAPSLFEMTSYHWSGFALRSGHFLPAASPVFTLHLDAEALAMKRRMLQQFRTQRQTIANLRLPACERFRAAPSYDFAAPPNGGRVFYDYFDWGLTSRDWCLYARSALEQLRLPASRCL